ncbi:MAG: Amidase [Verrucomicrobia bacterium]|nr:Amidase [Verrucomicrobiota bacterium]
MTFPEWRQLSPVRAAHEVHERVRTRLAPGQQRAAIASLLDEPALAARIAESPPTSPLRGIPYFIKDLFPVAHAVMRAGSTFLPEVRPTPIADSTMVSRLRVAGAALAGQTHLHEFAYGITGENPHYGDCEHPRFPGRVTGGSSSGSAAAVAAGIVPLAIGSDTGGSIRLPAAFCGIFGFRLTPRDAWIGDAFPLAPSYDTAGWFTENAEDMASTNAALLGMRRAEREPRGCYLEMPGLDADVAHACAEAAVRFTQPFDNLSRSALLSAFSDSVDTYNTVVTDEAWKTHEPWATRFHSQYDPAVWQRLNRVHTITTEQRRAAVLATAEIKRVWEEYFQSFDFLVLPASPFPALPKLECTLVNRARILVLTTPASIGGYPVLTVPVNLPPGLSTGLQIVVRSVDSPAIGWALKKFKA